MCACVGLLSVIITYFIWARMPCVLAVVLRILLPYIIIILATPAKQPAVYIRIGNLYSPPPSFPFPCTQIFSFPCFCVLFLFHSSLVPPPSSLLPPLSEDNHVERVRLDHIDVIRKGFSHGGHMRAVTYDPLKSLSIVIRMRRRQDTMKTYNLRARNAWICQK